MIGMIVDLVCDKTKGMEGDRGRLVEDQESRQLALSVA